MSEQRTFRGFMIFLNQLFVISSICMVISTQAFAQQDQPNIIFIVADDMGYGDSLALNSDSKVYMPNLARLAEEGVVFTRAYSSTPKCAPSRYSFLTGNYQWRGYKPYGWWNFIGGSQVLASQKTIANSLQPNFDTSMAGKYHLGGNFYLKESNTIAKYNDDENMVDLGRKMEEGARARGFDYSYILLRGIQDAPYAYFENDLMTSPVENIITWVVGLYDGYSRIIKAGIGDQDYDSSKVGANLTAAALTHLASVVDQPQRKPFFFYYPAVSAHFPATPPPYFAGLPVRGAQFSRRADMLFELDITLGLLLDFLDAHDLARDTLIVFTSDNGGPTDTRQNDINRFGHDVNGGLRGGKGEIWEGGVRIPLIMRWGDGTAAGSTLTPGAVSNVLIALQDLPATFHAVVGGLEDFSQFNDSFNMLPELMNPGQPKIIRKSLVLEARNRGNAFVESHFAIVESDWKLILYSNNDPEALFNLAIDPGETNNLVGDPEYANTIARLRNELLLLRQVNRTAPIQGPRLNADVMSGKPALTLEDSGVFLWSNDNNGSFELAVKSATGQSADTVIEIIAGKDFEWVSPVSLETYKDKLEWDGGNRIVFTSYTLGWPDGFVAKLPPETPMSINVQEPSGIKNLRYGSGKRQLSQSRSEIILIGKDQKSAVLPDAGIDINEISGKPNILSEDHGIFLWSTGTDGSFELSVKSADGQLAETTIEVIAENDFESVDPVNLEVYKDKLTWDGSNRIAFASYSTDGPDGFKAKLPSGSAVMIKVSESSDIQTLYYGPSKQKNSPNAWFLPLDDMTHDGSSLGSDLLANISLGLSSSQPDIVEMRWRGDDSGSMFFANLFFESAILEVSDYDPSLPFQLSKGSAKSLRAAAILYDEIGGINLSVPDANNIGLYFSIDESIPSHVFNLPSGLGSPNAYRLLF